MLRLLPLFASVLGGSCDSAPATMAGFVSESARSFKYETDIPTPQLGYLHDTFAMLPSACEVLVKVMASSVNPCDRGTDAARNPKVIGSDIAGLVVSTNNKGCTRLKVGDKVWADIGAVAKLSSTGASTKELGAYAQYALGIETQLGLMPANLSWVEAGSLPKVALTSYKALVWYSGAPWSHKPTVLILGGSGGTGTAGIQIARALGAGKIITTAGSGASEYCKGVGADEVYDYHTTNWWEDSVIADNTVDVVYDCVGQSGTADRAMKKLRTGGSFVTIAGGVSSHPKPGVKQNHFINSVTNLDNVKQLDAIAVLNLRMPVLDVFPLAQTQAAFLHMDVPNRLGKTVITMANSTEELLH